MAGELPETWFDTRDGILVIGKAALEEQLMQTDAPLIPLHELLTAKDFPFGKHSYDKGNFEGWTNEEYICLGKWALRIIQPEGTVIPTLALKNEHLRRLYHLGIGPYIDNTFAKKRFGSFLAFQETIGSPTRYFTTWSTERFVDLTAYIFSRTNRKPTKLDFMKEADRRHTPTIEAIKLRYGGITFLNALIGLPEPTEMDEIALVEWGVKVTEANPDKKFSWRIAEVLSARDCGPSPEYIRQTFKSWAAFIEKVEIAKNHHTKIIIPDHTEFSTKLYERFEASDAVLPDDFDEMEYGLQSIFFSHYLLAKAALGDPALASRIAGQQMVSSDPLIYISLLKKHAPFLKLSTIRRLSEEFSTYYPQPVWFASSDTLAVA